MDKKYFIFFITIFDLIIIAFLISNIYFYKDAIKIDILIYYLGLQLILILFTLKNTKAIKVLKSFIIVGVLLLAVFFLKLPGYTYEQGYRYIIANEDKLLEIDTERLNKDYFTNSNSYDISESDFFIKKYYAYYFEKENDIVMIMLNPYTGEYFYSTPITK